MTHEAHGRVIDAHPERRGGAHDPELIIEEA